MHNQQRLQMSLPAAFISFAEDVRLCTASLYKNMWSFCLMNQMCSNRQVLIALGAGYARRLQERIKIAMVLFFLWALSGAMEIIGRGGSKEEGGL